ncbi:MAG: hypothetical protein ACYCWE_15900 [Eubacteriales bacterium]
MINHDRQILRELAEQHAEISRLPQQKTNANNWRALHSLKPVKPMMMVSQIAWGEINACDELALKCVDGFCRGLEWQMREAIFKWNHFPFDMVVPGYLKIDKRINSTGISLSTQIESETGHNSAQTHLYRDQIADEAALEAYKTPVIRYDREATEKTLEKANSLVGDILPVKAEGVSVWAALWDRIVFLRGATPVLYDLADRPELIHKIMERFVKVENEILDQYEQENLLASPGFCHYAESDCDELYESGFDDNQIKAKNCWASGAAQIFSEVSPAMHDEFEIQYMKSYYERFGLVNYGCCEPLHRKIAIIRQIKNVRHISMSPWADADVAAEAMGSDYVMARKPNHAFLACDILDIDSIKNELTKTLRACTANNTPVEFILKDLTTIRGDADRLTQWNDLAKSVIENF